LFDIYFHIKNKIGFDQDQVNDSWVVKEIDLVGRLRTWMLIENIKAGFDGVKSS